MDTFAVVGLSLQKALLNALEVTADNLAQINTPGALQEDMVFSQYLTSDGQIAFVEDVATVKNMNPGPLEYTGDIFHLGNMGRGWFSVETSNGRRYTKNGAFTLDAEGQLVTVDGQYPVLNAGGTPIAIPVGDKNITVSPDGTIANTSGPIDTVGVFNFNNPYDITRTEGTLYVSNQEPTLADDISIAQGYIVGSNVDGISETNKLIMLNRLFQMTQKIIDTQNTLAMEEIQKMITVAPAA